MRKFLVLCSNNPLVATIVGTVIGTVIGTWVVAWKAPDLGGVLGSIARWLRAPAGASRLQLLTLTVLGILLGVLVVTAILQGEYQKLRLRERQAVPPAPQLPSDFNPTGVQLAAMGVLVRRYDCMTPLGMLHEDLKALTENAAGMPFLARQMENLERANVVRIDVTGRTDRSYCLTIEGRDWLLDHIKNAREHPEAGPEGLPQAPARFEPDKFTLSPLRARTLLALLDGVEARITIHNLHETTQKYSYEGRTYLDGGASKGRLQQDLEEGAELGIVAIESVPGGTSRYYGLSTRGRGWVLRHEAELRRLAPQSMTRFS